mgnify:FL=1
MGNTGNDSTVRLDKWLWAVRIFKTRSDAADACRTNKVLVNGSYVKPSREVRVGDTVTVKKMPVVYTYRVVALVSSRQPAKEVPHYAENLTPQEELDKLFVPKLTIFVQRDRGTGRPTKRERREIDSLMDEIYYDEAEDREDSDED